MDAAIFLDRDGVIIENRSDYVRSWSDVEIFPQALEALAGVRSKPFKVILVTNQSVVGRGLARLRTILEINDRLSELVASTGGRVDAVFICPHAPQAGCRCRKPRPGLLLQAASAFSLDLGRSILIGDALSDLIAGRSAGIKKLALVKTGRGLSQSGLPEAARAGPFLTFDTLSDALRSLV